MIEKCEKGKHYYDKKRYKTCPFCIEAERIATQKKQETAQRLDTENTISQTATM